MGFIRRPHKGYGSAKGRGRTGYVPKHKKQTDNAQARWYIVLKGTPIHVRKLGTKQWKPHTTKQDNRFSGFLWRNEYCYGFAQGDYEVKVAVGRFKVV